MSERGNQLFETADGQISELMCLVSRVGETGLSLTRCLRRGRHRVVQTKELT